MNDLRVFPRRTKATPDDALAVCRGPVLTDYSRGIDRVLVSVTFTYDMPRAEKLAREWSGVAPVEIGGPSMGKQSGEFVPGKFLKHGYTITSRGCPNRCWFCEVWKREKFIELPIRDGWIIQDDNFLRCSGPHKKHVYAMLARQPHRPIFAGGLEAGVFTEADAVALLEIKNTTRFFRLRFGG